MGLEPGESRVGQTIPGQEGGDHRGRFREEGSETTSCNTLYTQEPEAFQVETVSPAL